MGRGNPTGGAPNEHREVSIHVAPVLFGSGTPLAEALPEHVRLEQIGQTTTDRATHLRYRIAS